VKAIVKSAVISGAGALVLGVSLALSSAGFVPGSSARATGLGAQPDSTCTSSGYCLTEQNLGTGGAISGTSSVKSPKFTASVFGLAYGFDSIGVEGKSTGSGGTGLEGVSIKVSDGTGVYGEGAGIGISAYNPSCCNTFSYGLTTQVNDPSSFPLYTFGPLTAPASFSVDASANGVFDGSVTAFGGYFTVIRTGSAQVRASMPLAPRPTIEDTGTARLNDGVGAVRFERDFASTLDTSKGYQVFLTPDGDTRGLYVAQKYQAGFIVREAERGRSSLYFDYRVVGHVAGASDERFPAYHMRRPPRPLPAHPQ
jgi:hypothetical protein